jgi:hypothetical protein
MQLEETPEQKQRKTDEMVQLVMGVLLMAFAVVTVAVMLAMQVSSVLDR